MRVDKIIKDTPRALQQIVKALTHGVSAQENLSGEGSHAGQVLVSTGPNTAPVWMDVADIPSNGGTPPTPPVGPFKPLNADDLTSGTVPSGRLTGPYPGITKVGVLQDLQVDAVWMHRQLITRSTRIPAGWGSPLVGPIDVALGVTFDVEGVVEILG